MSTPLGIFLRALRLRAGLRQQELAEKVGYDASHVSGVELGRKNPSPEFLERFAESLQLAADEKAGLKRELADSPTSIQLIPDLPTDEYRMYAELGRKLGRLSPGQIATIRAIVRLDEEIRSQPAYQPSRIKRRSKEEAPM
ncbi:helix-turn-helix transcriptional regulator [Paraburkholderia sp. RAU2J]|uniref:helix-turn-helix domain-containing protein n=1 Tax=Paraburkholderia sp. RAU2J TaxID=1938810 RepID=UPI000EB0CFCB|nr:helix-turn-helix transcriptional regulator [Paraburkholderia sp. RAU2J]